MASFSGFAKHDKHKKQPFDAFLPFAHLLESQTSTKSQKSGLSTQFQL